MKTQLSKGEQKQIKRKIQQMKAALSKRLKEEEIDDDAIYEAEKPLMEDFKKVKLSKAEEHAIGRYTAGGYLDINRYLRNPQANALYEAKDLAINVRNVTQRAVVSKDTTVIRNIRPDALHLVFGRSKPYETVEEAYMELSRKTEKSKMVFREKGICSTTICPRGAIGFNTFPVEMRILVPKGSHGLYLEHTKMCMDGERELILAPDTDFQLIGVEKDVWRENYIAVDTDNRNMGDTKLIMYLTVLPKKTEAEQRAA